MKKEHCQCFDRYSTKHKKLAPIHREKQDTQCLAWQKLLDLIDRAARDLVEEFAPLNDLTSEECSVCRAKLEPANIQRRWISLLVATDVLPLLVHACSLDCIESLPPTPVGYISGAHSGGVHIKQPPTVFY